MATTIIDFVPGINQLKLVKKDESSLIHEARKTAKEIARLEPDAIEADAANGRILMVFNWPLWTTRYEIKMAGEVD